MNGFLEGLDTTSKLKAFLASRHITQAEFAKVVSLTPESVSNRMKTRKWDIAELRKVADHYKIDLTDLI